MAKTIDVISKKFGRYTVICKVLLLGDVRYKVYCDCGKSKVLDIWDIKNNVNGCNSCRSKMEKKNTKLSKIISHE